ncbi:MAG: VWA domain-containing protein [Coleofasciculaceae cyanobacterium SM2_3_26]|nr:VWA domain-containing protein [Coleofasciculaceae cyanobacterium SM2_3_26]
MLDSSGEGIALSEGDRNLDRTLTALYDSDRQGGLGSSAPSIARWLGDIRTYFPAAVVQVMQKDALERLKLHQMLLEPEFLEAVEPDVHLVTSLMSLSRVLPNRTRDTARLVVRRVVEALLRKLTNPTRQAIAGSLHRASRTRRPRHHEIDWHRTIRANLKHYQPQYRTIIPEKRIGFGHKRSSLRDIILCLDRSGSMAASLVYGSIFAAVLASLPTVSTRLVFFDTAVVDLTEAIADPVEVLFGTQLGGGTDIHQAIAYCQGLVRHPADTILVLISDLYEGGDEVALIKRIASLVVAGVQVIVLLALSDEGAPMFHHGNAQKLADLGVPAFACTPDMFPDLMAAALRRQDLITWVDARGMQAIAGS